MSDCETGRRQMSVFRQEGGSYVLLLTLSRQGVIADADSEDAATRNEDPKLLICIKSEKAQLPRSQFLTPLMDFFEPDLKSMRASSGWAKQMRVTPNFVDWASACCVHRRFASRPGAEHIATRRALACLSAVVRLHEPTTVLEFGMGIGTITYLLLSTLPRLNLIGLEANPFCLAQLDRNIPDELKPRLRIVTERNATLDGRFDLVVIDGRLPATDNWSFLRQGTIVFVEGNRAGQCETLSQIASSKNLVFDLEKQSIGETHLSWRKTRLGIPRPILARRKTCRIGVALNAKPTIDPRGLVPDTQSCLAIRSQGVEGARARVV